MTRFRLGTSCRDFVECCIFYFLFICSHFCNVTQGLRKYYWLGPFFKTHAVFVLTRGNNFLGLIANYVTHCVSLNTILSKHSCASVSNKSYYGIDKVGYREFQWKTGSLYFYWTYIRSSRTLSPRCLFPLRRVMAIKIIECLYTPAYAQLSRNFTSPFFSRSPSSTFPTYLSNFSRFFHKRVDQVSNVFARWSISYWNFYIRVSCKVSGDELEISQSLAVYAISLEYSLFMHSNP